MADEFASSFNELLCSFIRDLVVVFPENLALHLFLETFDALAAKDPRFAMDAFVAAVRPHADKLSAQDPGFFEAVGGLPGLDLAQMWRDPGLTESARAEIWKYMQSMWMLASLATSMPPEILNTAKALAQDLLADADPATLTLEAMVGKLVRELPQRPEFAQLAAGMAGVRAPAAKPGGAGRHKSKAAKKK